jgi:hypothetical protein
MSNDRSTFDPRFDPAFQRGFDGEVESILTERVSEPAIIEPVLSSPAVTEPQLIEISEPDARVRRINPFLIALGAVSVVLITGGLYLVSRLREFFDSSQTTSDFDFVTLQVLLYAAPLIVVLGLATAIGLVFIAAVRWGR